LRAGRRANHEVAKPRKVGDRRLGSVRAALWAQLVGVMPSKLPESSRVGIVLGVAAGGSADAFEAFHARHWSARYVTCRAGSSTEAG
jgi:hypothetical protein